MNWLRQQVHQTLAYSAIALAVIGLLGLLIQSYPELETDPSTWLAANRHPAVAGTSTLPGLADDGLAHPPPTAGTYTYNSFIPANTPGATYTDPVFGGT